MTRAQSPSSDQPTVRRRDLLVAGACGVFVALMVGAAFAAVPLYDWFCRSTGFGGTTQVATAAPGEVLERKLTVRFDANVQGGLPWRLEPERTSVEVRLGEVVTVMYRAINQSARETAGIASYNVSPPQAGGYFNKINCFCFTEQRLKAGEKTEFAVVFFIDPKLAQDSDRGGLNTITLSYTMYPVREPARPRVGTRADPAGRS
jgi:cytochrome c oxidase assembly protein subunit 11